MKDERIKSYALTKRPAALLSRVLCYLFTRYLYRISSTDFIAARNSFENPRSAFVFLTLCVTQIIAIEFNTRVHPPFHLPNYVHRVF